jgi:hypothetical protein
MASKITPEQQADLIAHSGQPVPVKGDGGDVVCYMVDATAFLHMQGIAGEPSAENEQRLKGMIQEGLDSPDISAEQVYQELRERVKQVKQTNA